MNLKRIGLIGLVLGIGLVPPGVPKVMAIAASG